jgi:hypothetical protein
MSNIDGLASTFRGGVSGFLGHEGTPVTPLPGSGGGSSSAVVLDNTATVKYPTAPQTNPGGGVWYGAGTKANIAGNNAVVLGNNATSGFANVTVIGTEASGISTNATAVGYQATAGQQATAIGRQANAQITSVAVGLNSNAAQLATAIGYSANAEAIDSIAIGHLAYAAKAGDIAIGSGATTSAAPGSETFALNIGQTVDTTVYNQSDAYIDVLINGTPYQLLLHT